MNTGHDGSLSTGHANSTKDMLSRLETMILFGVELPLEAIRQQIASAIDIIIHLGRIRDMSRKTLEIVELSGYKAGDFQLNSLFNFSEDVQSEHNKVQGKLKRTGNLLMNTNKLKTAGMKIWK